MRKISLALLLAIGALGAGPAAADDPLAILPGDAALVVRMTSLERFASGLKETVSALGPLAAPAAENVDFVLNALFQIDADGAAIDRAAPAYLAAFALPDKPEPLAWMVKAPDEAKLRRAVLKAGADETLTVEKRPDGFEKLTKDGRDWFFGRRGDWVLYTRREEVVKSLAFDPQSQPAFAKQLEGRGLDLAAEGDASAIVNVARLIEVYGAKLDDARDKLRRQIDTLPKEFLGGDSSAIDPRATKKMYADLADLAIGAVYDAQWAAARVKFTTGGVGAAALVGVKAETATDRLLAANPPVNFETLGLLPAGATVYAAYTSNSPRLVDWTRNWLKLAYGEGSEVTQKLLRALDSIVSAEVASTSACFAFPSGSETGFITASLTQAKEPEKLRSGLTAYEPAANRQDTALFSQSVELKTAAETYQDRAVDLLTTRFKFKDVADPGQAIGQKFMEKMLGGTEAQTRLTALEGMLVKAGGNDPKYLHGVIDGLQTGEKVLGLDESFAATRDQLADKANIVALLDAPRLVIDLVGMLRSIPPLDAVLAQAPINLGIQPAASYAGVSLAAQPQALRVDLFVPLSQPRAVLQIFGQ